MNAYLFGAGASHSYDRSKTGVNPPLAAKFFPTFNQLDISGDLLVRIGDIVNYVRDTRGIPPLFFNMWNENIEDFLSEIDNVLGNDKQAARLDIGKAFQMSRAYDQ